MADGPGGWDIEGEGGGRRGFKKGETVHDGWRTRLHFRLTVNDLALEKQTRRAVRYG